MAQVAASKSGSCRFARRLLLHAIARLARNFGFGLGLGEGRGADRADRNPEAANLVLDFV
jgi:hypothetical protein